MALVVVFILYNMFGMLYNLLQDSSLGLSAIPHLEFYKSIPNVLKVVTVETFSNLILVLALARGYLKSKIDMYKAV